MKPLTKALHTVRVVRLLAEHVAAIFADDFTSDTLLDEVLGLLENARPTDPVLLAACLAACAEAIGDVAGRKYMAVYVLDSTNETQGAQV